MMFKLLLALSAFIIHVNSHGYMFNPINRASRWRLDKEDESIPHCYDDNQFYCGGLTVQYSTNEGKCGACGDDYRNQVPRSNENGGTYGNGVVVASYYAGSLIDVDVTLTTNHLGKISFQLCKLEDTTAPEEDECFTPLSLEDGSYYQPISYGETNVTSSVQLPEDITCDRCVLRWHYEAGNNWGDCGNGTQATGCGPQETFRSCADISILRLS